MQSKSLFGTHKGMRTTAPGAPLSPTCNIILNSTALMLPKTPTCNIILNLTALTLPKTPTGDKRTTIASPREKGEKSCNNKSEKTNASVNHVN